MTVKRRAGDAMRRGVLGVAQTTGVLQGIAEAAPEQQSPGGQRPAGEAQGGSRMSKYTAMLDVETATAFDELALCARRVKGRKVEKSEIVRVLIMLASDDASLRDQVIGQLPDEGPVRNARGTR